MAIKTGMKVPEVLIPTITRKNTTITTPIGSKSKFLNSDCSSAGRADSEKGTNSSPAATSKLAFLTPAATALTELFKVVKLMRALRPPVISKSELPLSFQIN